MTIKQVIEELKKYPNQDAEVNFIANTTNVEDEVFDTEKCEIAFMEQDKEDCPIYDIMIYIENKYHNETCLTELLAENRKLTIKLDCDSQNHKIVILDNKEQIIDCHKCDGYFRDYENIIKHLKNIL